MKKFYLKKFLGAFGAFLLAASPAVAHADELTVNNGTSTNAYVPFYFKYADYAQKCEFIIPASDLASLGDSSNITSLKFYSNTASKNWGCEILVFLKEVEIPTSNGVPYLSSFMGQEGATIVYDGNDLQLDSNKEMVITFSQPYSYKGGNLLIGIYKPAGGNYYSNMTFYGINPNEYLTVSGYNSSTLDKVEPTPRYFRPKTTITYEEAISIEGPSIAVSDYPNGSEYDFGIVPEGTEHIFRLINQGSAELNIENIEITEQFTLSNPGPLTIPAGETAEITVSTPAADAEGEMAIYSNDEQNSPYVIKLKSVYKVPRPQMEVSAKEINFGKVTEDASGSFTVTNSGDALLEVTLTSDNNSFTLEPTSLSVEPGQSKDVAITFLFDSAVYGVNSAVITLTPNDGDAVTLNALAKVSDPDAWSEDFSGAQLPSGWEADTQGWSVADGVAKGKYVYSGRYYLTTPSLVVEEGNEMTFQYRATSNYVDIYIQYSKDGGEFTDYTSISDLNQMSEFKEFAIKGLPAGNYRFRFRNDNYELDNFEGFKLNMNDPKLEVSPAEDAVFGKVTSQPEPKRYTVINAGTGQLSVNIASSSDDFTISPAEITAIDGGDQAEFTVSFNFDIDNLGEKQAVITVTPTYNPSATVSFNATAIAKDPDLWEEDFEDGKIPEGWSNSGWTIEKTGSFTGNGTYMAYAGTSNNTMLVTPRLYAEEGKELSFEVGKSTDSETPLYLEYSHDRNVWTDISPIESSGQHTFTAPETGYYYLRFHGKYSRIDNFSGFRLAMKDHEISVGNRSIPLQGHQYVDYTASVTLMEMTGKEEKVRAALYFGEDEVAVVEAEMAPNATSSLELSFTPEKAYESVATSIVISYADGETLRVEGGNVSITEAPVWSEEGQHEFEYSTHPAVVFDYKPCYGWNTISVPFALDDESLTQIFGPGYMIYELKAYENDIIKFQIATQYNGKYAAGYPYIVYVKQPNASYGINDEETEQSSPVILKDVKIEQTSPQQDTRGPVAFRGTFAAGDTADDVYGINESYPGLYPASELRSFRAYITLDPTPEVLPQVKFYDGSGVETGVESLQMELSVPEGIFNLNGMRVKAPLAPGIYIIDGKKTIIK